MERMMNMWIKNQNQQNMPVNMHLALAKARSIYEDVAKAEEDIKVVLNASSRWFTNFRKTYNFHIIKMTGKAASVDINAAEEFTETLKANGNTEGDCTLKPVMIYHSVNPHAVEGYIKHLLSIHFYSNAKGWIMGNIFCDYLVSKLEDELHQYCMKENLDFELSGSTINPQP
jgi:hypothetical protein